MNWYLLAFQKYADFKTRSRRSEFWYFGLFNFLAIMVIGMISGMLSTVIGDASIGLIGVYYLAIIIPSLAVAVRRLHDTGRSGWWYLISLIPLIGSIVLIVFFCEDSKPGPNQWGPNPKEVGTNVSSDPTILDDGLV